MKINWQPAVHAALQSPWPAVGAGIVVAATGAWLLIRRLRRRSPEEVERLRRLYVNSVGRIAGGEILEMLPGPDPEQPPVLVYQYEVAGVTYQVSQDLFLVPLQFDPRSWIPGWPVQVKFDPANPGNSIVACEHWRGLALSRTRAAAASGPV